MSWCTRSSWSERRPTTNGRTTPSRDSLADTATLIEQKSPGTLRRLFDDPNSGPLWNEPNHSFYAAFAGYILATELAFTLMLSYDAEATLSGDNDPNSPDQLWNTFGGDLDGF